MVSATSRILSNFIGWVTIVVNPKVNPVMMIRGDLRRLLVTGLTMVNLSKVQKRTSVLSLQRGCSFDFRLLVTEGNVSDSEDSCWVDKV